MCNFCELYRPKANNIAVLPPDVERQLKEIENEVHNARGALHLIWKLIVAVSLSCRNALQITSSVYL